MDPPQSPSFGPPHFRGREGGETGREGARGGVQTSGFGIGGREGARGGGWDKSGGLGKKIQIKKKLNH